MKMPIMRPRRKKGGKRKSKLEGLDNMENISNN